MNSSLKTENRSSELLPEELDISNSGAMKIYTLGRFSVNKETQCLSEKCKRSNKIWELFKYLLTNRGKPLPVERIIDDLWPDQDYNDHSSALHTLSHRMRNLFFEEFPNIEKPFQLDVSQGCYCINLNSSCWLDLDHFSVSTYRAMETRVEQPETALNLFNQAINLYSGDYLPEYASKKWVLPAKRHYRNLYLQSLHGAIDILLKSKKYGEVCSLCERAFRIESFIEAENLHSNYMKALYKDGRTKEALNHYEFLSSALYQEYGTKPPAAMRDIYRRVKNDPGTSKVDFNVISDKYEEKAGTSGAFICDQDFFRFLYRLETRRNERTKAHITLGLFTVNWLDYNSYCSKELSRAMDNLENILLSNLRRGDVITRLGEAQYLSLLVDLNRHQANQVFERIKQSFREKIKNGEILLEVNRKSKYSG
jgi:two-component SAPR family response regulator